MNRCSEDGCSEPAAVQLYIPWADDRVVCVGHGRSYAQRDGVVAEPIDGTSDEWP